MSLKVLKAAVVGDVIIDPERLVDYAGDKSPAKPVSRGPSCEPDRSKT